MGNDMDERYDSAPFGSRSRPARSRATRAVITLSPIAGGVIVGVDADPSNAAALKRRSMDYPHHKRSLVFLAVNVRAARSVRHPTDSVGINKRGTTMSVTVISHFAVPDVAKAVAAVEASSAVLEEITEASKSAGCLHHKIVAGDGEFLVIDEWGTKEQYESFFAANRPKIAAVSGPAGVTDAPRVSTFISINAAGFF